MDKALAGMRVNELDLATGPLTLSRLEGDGLAFDDFVVFSMPSSYFSRDPIASIGTGVALHRMYHNQRNREVPFYKTFLTYHRFCGNARSGTTTIARPISRAVMC